MLSRSAYTIGLLATPKKLLTALFSDGRDTAARVNNASTQES